LCLGIRLDTIKPMRQHFDDRTAFTTFARLTDGKWKILYHLLENPMAADDLARRVPKLSKLMLVRRLHELELAGLIERLPDSMSTNPTYKPTTTAMPLQAVYRTLYAWGANYKQKQTGQAASAIKS
jgi:DNA-binding HxlR family transcriptional regulator